MKEVMLPKAKAILAILIVTNVKTKVLKDFIYLLISKKIKKFTKIINENKIEIFKDSSRPLIRKIENDIKINIGKIG